MTDAITGMAKALARGASGEVIAIAELSAADLLASMSDEQKAEMQASLNPPASAADHGEPDKMEPDDDEDDADCKDKKKTGCDDGANASAHDRVKAVASAVALDPACKGKAAIALDLLADDDFASLSASALIKAVAKAGAPESSADDGDAGARAEMQAALSAQRNSNIDANNNAQADAGKNSAAVWDTAFANEFGNRGR